MTSQEHYFSEEPDVESSPFDIDVRARGRQLTIRSDRGIFSANQLDKGTAILAETMRIPETGHILDLGCGYGILGLLAALESPDADVTFIDINRRAIRLAKYNCRRRELNNVEFITGDARQALGDRIFDTILCNPPMRAGKDVYMGMLQKAAEALNPGGELWLVGRTKQGIKTLKRDISPHFQDIETVEKSSGYRVLRCDAAS